MLLESGADPRLLADDGATPAQVKMCTITACIVIYGYYIQVAANPAVEECLKAWDIEATNKLLACLEEQKGKRLERDAKLRQAEESKSVPHRVSRSNLLNSITIPSQNSG